MANIDLYSNYIHPTKIGVISIEYGKIVHIDLKIPKDGHKQEVQEAYQNKPRIKYQLFEVIQANTAYNFKIVRLSKADLPYRQSKLTHKLICPFLKAAGLKDIFIKPSVRQLLLFHFQNQKFEWQKTKFWNGILSDTVKTSIIAILAFIGGIMVTAIQSKRSHQNQKKNIESNQRQKTEKNNSDNPKK